MEQWCDIPGYEGIYAVSDQGDVRRLSLGANGASKPGRILKPRPLKSGYLRINLGKNGIIKDYLIHRIVLLAFVGEPFEGAVCNHKNGIKSDNRLVNLEWVTQGQNNEHSRNVLGGGIGVRAKAAKLKPTEVRTIRSLYRTGQFRMGDIAKAFGVSRKAISKIVNYKTWKHVK